MSSVAPHGLYACLGVWSVWGVLFENYTVDASILFFVLCEHPNLFMLFC